MVKSEPPTSPNPDARLGSDRAETSATTPDLSQTAPLASHTQVATPLRCAACGHRFREPCLLPNCGHTICTPCADARRMPAGKNYKVICPEPGCLKTSTTSPHNGGRFVANAALVSLFATSAAAPQLLTCGVCGGSELPNKAWFCAKEEKILCSFHAVSHTKKEHDVSPYSANQRLRVMETSKARQATLKTHRSLVESWASEQRSVLELRLRLLRLFGVALEKADAAEQMAVSRGGLAAQAYVDQGRIADYAARFRDLLKMSNGDTSGLDEALWHQALADEVSVFKTLTCVDAKTQLPEVFGDVVSVASFRLAAIEGIVTHDSFVAYGAPDWRQLEALGLTEGAVAALLCWTAAGGIALHCVTEMSPMQAKAEAGGRKRASPTTGTGSRKMHKKDYSDNTM